MKQERNHISEWKQRWWKKIALINENRTKCFMKEKLDYWEKNIPTRLSRNEKIKKIISDDVNDRKKWLK